MVEVGSDAADLKPSSSPPRGKPSPRRTVKARGAAYLVGGIVTLMVSAYGLQDVARRVVGEYWIAYPTLESLDRAVQLIPENDLGWYRRGTLRIRGGGDPADAIADFRKAIELRPNSPQSLIALGFALETTGEAAEAELRLLQAAESDSGFMPRWSLANFYLRHQREEEFWRWIREAVSADPDQLSTAMTLCWRAYDDTQLILDRGVPDNPIAYRGYFSFLLVLNRMDLLSPIWAKIEDHLDASHLGDYIAYFGYLLGRDVGEAVEVWNRLCASRLLPYDSLSVESGRILTNPGLERPSGRGFDWAVSGAEGLEMRQVSIEGETPAFEIRFSGVHPERTDLVGQLMPAAPGRSYRFNFEYRTDGLPEKTGLRWIVRTTDGREIAATDVLRFQEESWGRSSLQFSIPVNTALVRLGLVYERSLGTTRTRGAVQIRALALGEGGGPGPSEDRGDSRSDALSGAQ